MKFKHSSPGKRLTKKDIIILLIIMLIYSAIAFYRLGYNYAPETGWNASRGQNIILDLGSPTDISTIDFYIGNYAYYDRTKNIYSVTACCNSYKTCKRAVK